MGIQSLIISDQVATGAYPQSPLTQTESALKARADLLCWVDAKGYERELAGDATLAQWRSRQLIGANQPQFNALTTNDYPYGGYDPSDPTQFEFRTGMNAAGANISGFNHRKMVGNSFMNIPSGDFTVAYFLRALTPGNLTVFGGTNSTTQAMALACTSAGVIRFYSNYQTNTFIATAASVLNTAYHLVVFKYNAAAIQGSIELDETVVKTPSALTIPQPYTDAKFNHGFVTSGATVIAGTGWASQGMLIISSIDDVTLDLYKAVLVERGVY